MLQVAGSTAQQQQPQQHAADFHVLPDTAGQNFCQDEAATILGSVVQQVSFDPSCPPASAALLSNITLGLHLTAVHHAGATSLVALLVTTALP